MHPKLKQWLLTTLGKYDYVITRKSVLHSLLQYEGDLGEFLSLPDTQLTEIVELARLSKAQLKQDLFVLKELQFKREGFFVEFGATNGVELSNTHLLEKRYGWKGILAEPARCWHEQLRQNRKCHIETKCVWRDTGSTLTFNEIGSEAALSTISTYNKSDHLQHARANAKTYNVDTISLVDLLEQYDAPRVIDYLSIDTEGSEYDILEAFDYGRYSFNTITCEHNYTPIREKIFDLLTSKGYVRKYIGLSKWDDWYVRKL